MHELVELGVVDVCHFLQDGSGDEGEYGEAYEVCHKVDGIDGDEAMGCCLLELAKELSAAWAYLAFDAGRQLVGVVAQLVEDEQGQIGVFGQEVDIHVHDLAQSLVQG